MKTQLITTASVAVFATTVLIAVSAFGDPDDYGRNVDKKSAAKTARENKKYLPATVDDARGRAKVLHEAIHGALQVMHRDFFGADEDLDLPSQSLEDVFKELERSHHVHLHWLTINAKVMDKKHVAQNRFEERVVVAFDEGKVDSLDVVEGNMYRHAGLIKLQNACLKCHVPNRKTLEDRAAALVITIPLREGATGETEKKIEAKSKETAQ